MKSRLLQSRTEAEKLARKVAEEECKKMYEQALKEATRDVTEHHTAVFLYVLAKDFKFGAKRLNAVLKGCTDFYTAMAAVPDDFPMGSHEDVIEYLKSRYGIDLHVY